MSAQAAAPSIPSSSDVAADACDTTENDHLLAQMLQYEFDLQHDMQIELNQRQMNKNSKCEYYIVQGKWVSWLCCLTNALHYYATLLSDQCVVMLKQSCLKNMVSC